MKLIYLLFSVFLFLAISNAQSNPVVYSVLYGNGQYSVIEGYSEYSVAMASHDAEQDKTGWNHLKISIVKSNPSSSQIKMKAAGFLEGYITQKEIFNSYFNFANGTGDPTTPQMRTFIEQNDNWLRQNAFQQNADTYWSTIALLLSQYDGIIAGYQAAAPQGQNLTRYQLMVYALQFELGDIAIATSLRKSHLHASFHKEPYPSFIEKFARDHPFFKTNRGQTKIQGDMMGEHCSSCVKLTANNAKLMTSHDTWSQYNTMLREYKHYDLETGKVQFSSYPGLPYSGDDFYINSNKLVVMETTNSIFDNSLYAATTVQTVPYWLRVQVATYLATTGPQWHNYFQMYNNGGYNNQWIIIDYKLFTPGNTLLPNTLVIGEQVPGHYVYDDQTSFLSQNGYWASYNIPFYPFIYNISGYPAMYQKYGNAYSWSMCARAQIYRRDQDKAQNFTLFQDLQRYNHWQVDPLSLQDSCRGISARCDLNFPWNNNTLNGYAAFGAIDSKATDESLVGSMVSYAVAGPSWRSQPIFWWSDSWQFVPHQGLVPIYAFDWVKMK